MKSWTNKISLSERYENDFLNWKNDSFFSDSKYSPKFHIYGKKGLINDPTGIIYDNGIYHILFQHHPKHTTHGLKTFSLASTKDFKNFNYTYMVNKPDNEFDSHGTYTGSLIKKDNKIFSFYSGNKRDKNWIRTASIIKSEFDLDNKKIINKEMILNNFQYSDFTEHFRDPFVFEFKNNYYFLLGAQDRNTKGYILLFLLDKNLSNPKLVKKIFVNEKFRMIECPNIIFDEINNVSFLIFSGQDRIVDKNKNPDVVYYSHIETNKLFDNNTFISLNDLKILDYGFEFYAPQVFKKDNKNYLIAWAGIPTSDMYLEKDDNWLHMLSSIRAIEIKNNELFLFLTEEYKQIVKENKSNCVNSIEVSLKSGESLLIKDNNRTKLEIIKEKSEIKIIRYNAKNYHPYDNFISLKNFNDTSEIELFIDNSIIEGNIDNYSFTSRIYFDKKIVFEKKENINNYKNYMVFDIGGTYIKWSIINSNYQILKHDKFPFDSINRNCKVELINEINLLIEKYIDQFDLLAIGISTAGDVNEENTIIGSVPNHKNYINTNFDELIGNKFNIDVIADNDANCAVYGEKLKGELINVETGVLLTLGTDIGGGIIINNNVYRGVNATAGEIGYLNVNGLRYGTYFSAIGLSRLTFDMFNIKLKPEEILSRYDEFKKSIDFWYEGLSIGIANIIALINPEIVIIGGGLSESNLINLSLIETKVTNILNQDHLLKKTKIILSKYGNKSALFGCVGLINKHYNINHN